MTIEIMNKFINRAIYWFLSLALLWGQNVGQISATEAQLRQKMLRQQTNSEQILEKEKSLDELMLLEERFDSTNVPVKIIVTPSELKEFYNLKLKRIRDDIIGLNVIESLLDTVGQLNHFGYDYFFNFEQRELWERTIPPTNYVLSPGDEIIISIWGQTERREKKIIGRDGKIFIGDVGQIAIGGLTLSDAMNNIKNRLVQVYETIQGPNAKTFLDLTHAKISGKTVSFTGRVIAPGFHVVTPYVDPLTALIYAGGVDTTGSLRGVVFLRNNTPLDTLDLYAFLLDGAPSSSHFMRDGDRLHIPNRLSTVTVSGAVRHPGYFELKPNESLGQALRYAGGLKVEASKMIHLRRLSNSITENRYNNYYFHSQELDQISMQDGDSLSIYYNLTNSEIYYI